MIIHFEVEQFIPNCIITSNDDDDHHHHNTRT